MGGYGIRPYTNRFYSNSVGVTLVVIPFTL